MSSINPGVQPGTGSSQGVPGRSPSGPQGKVSGDDAQAFDSAMEKGAGKAKKESDQEELLTPEEQLRKMMSQQVVQQITERSKEFTEEAKKNFEG